jgi:hypothetical protein
VLAVGSDRSVIGRLQQVSGPVAGLTTTISVPHEEQRSRVPAGAALFMASIVVADLLGKQAIG